jgi:hypothetical protein
MVGLNLKKVEDSSIAPITMTNIVLETGETVVTILTVIDQTNLAMTETEVVIESVTIEVVTVAEVTGLEVVPMKENEYIYDDSKVLCVCFNLL